MIEDSLKRRAHVVDYDTEVIPTLEEVKKILKVSLDLVTSKQKGYPYQVFVLGPNEKRSNNLWQMCEGNKIETDTTFKGLAEEKYRKNPGLYHLRSAPWTLIFTPRKALPNQFHKRFFDESHSYWELDDARFVNKDNRQACGIEIGMLAKTITGAVLDRGWDTSYNVCFPGKFESWKDYPFIPFTPALIQTIGKATLYKWQTLTEELRKLDTDVPFETMFKFIEENNNE